MQFSFCEYRFMYSTELGEVEDEIFKKRRDNDVGLKGLKQARNPICSQFAKQ